MSESSNIVDKIANGKWWLTVAMWVVGVAITIGLAYTTATLTKGADAQRLTDVERRQTEAEVRFNSKLAELQKQIDNGDRRYVTREELDAHLRGQTLLLQSIERNMSEIRSRAK